jgi:hypothetical protein
VRCGTPYRLYHYENDERVERPPTVALSESGVEIARRYWEETRNRVFPACYDMGILGGGRGRSYSGASIDDCEAFKAWYDKHYQSDGEQDAEASTG